MSSAMWKNTRWIYKYKLYSYTLAINLKIKIKKTIPLTITWNRIPRNKFYEEVLDLCIGNYKTA